MLIPVSVTAADVTDTVLVPVAPPMLAVTAMPFPVVAPAVTRPPLLTAATPEFADSQVALDVTSAVLASV